MKNTDMNVSLALLRLHLQTLFNGITFLLFLSDTPMSLSIALMGNDQVTAPLKANLVIIFLGAAFILELISLVFYLMIVLKKKDEDVLCESVRRYQLVAILSLILLFISMAVLNVLPEALFASKIGW